MDSTVPADIEPTPNDNGRTRMGLVIWLGSAVTHACALGLLATIYFMVAADEPIDLPPSTIRPIQVTTQTPVTAPPSIEEQPIELPTVAEVVQEPSLLEPIALDEAPGDDLANPELPPMEKGDPLAKADMELGVPGLTVAIGADGGAMTKFGGPYAGRGKRGPRGPSGSPPFTSKATKNALHWFRRHQSLDGSWDASDYWRNCSEAGAKCEPGKDQSGDTDVAMTAYAVLCFLGDGYDHQAPSHFRSTVRKGLQWLVASQKPDGLLGSRNYEHAIATMVLAQAYGMVPDPWLREPAQKAVDVLLARQNRDPQAQAPYDRLGWDYGNPSRRNDASVTGWAVMALKSAFVAGLRVGEGMDGCKAWLERSWTASNTGQPWCAKPEGLDAYRDISRFAYVWNTGGEVQISGWAGDRPASTAKHDLAPVGLMSAVFLGHMAGDPMLETLGNYVARFHQPTAWPCNTYNLYYNTLGLFQLGGERWEGWAKTVLPMLRDAQRMDEGCLQGSWDWQGTQFHGHDTGRVLSTAYACLTMQVYWIYERQIKAQKKR